MTDIDWYGPDAATFGDRVAAAREQAGMTQQVLAKRLGIRLKTLKSWEDDMSEPRANRLSILAGLLNVSMMWLINGEGEGIHAPLQPAEGTSRLAGILSEMCLLRVDMQQKAAQLGRLEQQLRQITAQASDD